MIDQPANEWRASQQRLSELERQYADAMLAYCRGDGPPPSDEMKARIVALRTETEKLLARTMAEVDRGMIENARKLDRY